MKNLLLVLLFAAGVAFTGCESCEDCTVKTVTTDPSSGFSSEAEVGPIEYCDDKLDAVKDSEGTVTEGTSTTVTTVNCD